MSAIGRISKIDIARHRNTDLRKCAVVPNITMVGETIPHEAETATFDILLDRIEGLFL